MKCSHGLCIIIWIFSYIDQLKDSKMGNDEITVESRSRLINTRYCKHKDTAILFSFSTDIYTNKMNRKIMSGQAPIVFLT